MNIGIFTNNYLPNPYGVSGSVESFRQAFEDMGHEVFIFAPRWEGYGDKNPHVFRYPSVKTNIKIRFPLPIPYSFRMEKIIEKLDFDIIHSQHPNLLGSAARRVARKKNIPLVFTWHTLYDQYAHFVPFIPSRVAAAWTIRNAVRYANRCDQIIVPTASIIDIIKQWGVTNKNISDIPTGIDEKQYSSPNRKDTRKKYGILGGEVLLLLVTRLSKEKNVEFLIDALSETVRKNKNIKFMICGEGDLKEELMEKVLKQKLAEKIIFTGFVSNIMKWDYYAAGDIFVYASKSETQGMILTEAMYSGLPIVAVRATGAKDIVEDGRTGFLVSDDKWEFQKMVEKLASDKKLRRELGENAEKIARKRYTAKACAERMIEVYEKAISAKLKS